jgi:helicase
MSKSVSEIAGPGVEPWLREYLAFRKLAELTDIQSRAIAAGIANRASVLVSAPTSSGKTLVGEIAMLASIRQGARALYLVSHKALADQKFADFRSSFGEDSPSPYGSVGLATGDRLEGDADAIILVATYEKALGLLLSGQIRVSDAVVIADELQIIGEKGRGPEIETLCTLLRLKRPAQFVALTATMENTREVADWLGSDLVTSSVRDVPLLQQVWYDGKRYEVKFGDEVGADLSDTGAPATRVDEVVDSLLAQGMGPVLVFTETRREAADLAKAVGNRRQRAADGIELAGQLDFFSEPTESSRGLRESAERRVAFHTADLSPQERQVLEAGFSAAKFDACFATSTLAAGVNYPFKTVVIAKLTYDWTDRAGTMISRSDYRNMSGRAGRLGLFERGYSVLLPTSRVELAWANRLVLPENERVESQLVALSLRKTVLTLVASRAAKDPVSISAFFRNSLYWHQLADRNPKSLERIAPESKTAIEWLCQAELLEAHGDELVATPIGLASAASGLLPTSAVDLVRVLRSLATDTSTAFAEWANGIIFAACACDEFTGDRPTRYLPYATKKVFDAIPYWSSQHLFGPLDRTNLQLAQAAQAIVLFAEGAPEREIAFQTGISAGNVHRLAQDVGWILDGMNRLASVRDLGCSQRLGNELSMLARSVRWGAPAEALDIVRLAERNRVPGMGRQRAMALVDKGLGSINDVVAAEESVIAEVVGSLPRAKALRAAIANATGIDPARLRGRQKQLSAELGLQDLIETSHTAMGIDYEQAILNLLSKDSRFVVTHLDDGIRQNVPDILFRLGEQTILLECKTSARRRPLVAKEEAWAVVQKAADYDAQMRRVTLGKPGFDETSRRKVATATDLTLVEHEVFVEGWLRVQSGVTSPEEFVSWLMTPGVAELLRLPIAAAEPEH